MTALHPTALIADDEPLLRQELSRLLGLVWPELQIVALARNGREALREFDALHPDVCFLDVKMPGFSGVEVASRMAGKSHIVFVTAYDQYAVEAFAHGAVDYLVKPIEVGRLAETVARIKKQLAAANRVAIPPELPLTAAPEPLQWIQAQRGSTVRMVSVEDVEYLRSDTKYTRVAWCELGGPPEEALVRLSLKELLERLDPARFVQIHRSIVVNLSAVKSVSHEENGTATLRLKKRPEVLPVSRSYVHRFRQM